ncbi:MAG: hypothetical protein MI724_02150 [Spirochaetales bacterium]|nr:hypothetical protein [Spirochaetales bacterium]
MKRFGPQLLSRNPVWVAPLALPIALFASQTVELAALFAILVLVVVPLTHGISYFVEAWLPRYLRLVAVLIVASTVLAVAETVLRLGGWGIAGRSLYMMRAITVSGLVVWPTSVAPRDERFTDRLAVSCGLAVGFVIGFVPLAATRILFIGAGYRPADSVFMGFLLLAVGNIVINVYRRLATDQRGRTPDA